MKKKIKQQISHKLTKEGFLATRLKVIQQKEKHKQAKKAAIQRKLEGLKPVKLWKSEPTVRWENLSQDFRTSKE